MASTSFAAPIGEILDGKFRVTKEIGRGGMATVYSAENISIGKLVAVKILASELATSKTVTERFLREARAAARIHSPYICEVYDVGTYDDRPFIVMELLRGESLYDRLARERTLSFEETLRIAIQTAKGLKKAHELQVVHRDLKPENIFLTEGEDGASQTKLVDFGLAKFYEPTLDPNNARLTKEGALFGTPAYMSPEQAKAKGNVDQRSDLWALGCIVFEMLTGRTVWDVEQGVAMILAQIATAPIPSARTYRPDLPPQFDAWLSKALSRSVEGRFQDADEFVFELRRALGPAEISSPGPTLSSGHASSVPPSPPAPRSPAGPPSPPWATSSQSDTSDPGQPSLLDSAQPARRRWIGFALGAFVLGVGAGAWLYWGNVNPLLGGAPPSAETSALAAEIGEAQGLLANGDVDQSLALLKATFEKGQGKAARSLLANAGVAAERSGECRLTAVGHPRPFDSSTESSEPTLLEVPAGVLVAWADKDPNTDVTQTRLTVVDSALRRIGAVSNLTPESHTTREPQLVALADKLGLAFWDLEGPKPGAFTRLLTPNGEIAGPSELLSSSVAKHPYNLALAADKDGGYWTVWVEPSRDRVFDLVVRKLNERLQPIGEPIAVTGYATPLKGKTQADRPSIAVTDKLVVVSYTLRRNNKQQLLVLRIAKDKLKSGSGVVPDQQASAPGDEESDRFLGQAQPLSEAPGNHDQSSVRCAADGQCFIAWDDAQNAGYIALLQEDGRLVWRKSLGAGSARPGLSLSAEGTMLSWYDNKRVQIARLSPAGPAAASAVGRISAVLQQPPPLVVPSKQTKGRWYVAWRGYEAAVQEPFLARVDCP